MAWGIKLCGESNEYVCGNQNRRWQPWCLPRVAALPKRR